MEESKLEGEEEPRSIEAGSEKRCLIGNLCRKEKRKVLKKMKRKQLRKEMALKELKEEEARLNDPDEQRRIRLVELEEEERSEKERKLFEERERAWIEAMELKKRKMAEEEEEEQRRNALEEQSDTQQTENESKVSEEDDWEYVEGPAEVIWKGDEIILKKKMIRVPKKVSEPQKSRENVDRPTSNPLPPQSEAFMGYRNTSISFKQEIEEVASQVPNFGTEQDKSHCPFHLKTGACRFGQRCSRVHFYPDKSCTLLIKNMYNGPGLAWEQDEGLEYTDEEVERCYEEFYEDVHTEFLKYGEIINFKVCKNGSFHLKGNVYVHYKSLDTAVLAYNAINGRFYAGKQIICEFVNVTRWKVAICGEFMKTRYKTCSHGTTCNFIHCFRNPGGDYEWADSDRPPPRYWMKKMTSLFGFFDDSGYDKHIELDYWDKHGKSSQSMSTDGDRYHSRRSKIKYLDHPKDADSGRSKSSDRHFRRQKILENQESFDKEAFEKAYSKEDRQTKRKFDDADSDDPVNKMEERNKCRDRGRTSKSSKSHERSRARVGNAVHADSKNTTNDTDKKLSSVVRDEDGNQSKRRENNGHISKTPKTKDGSPSSKTITYDPERRGNCSNTNKEKYLVRGKKTEKHWKGKTRLLDDQMEREYKLKTDYHDKESTAGKSSMDSSHGDVSSNDSREPSISDQYIDRFEPLNIEKVGRWEPEKSYEKFEKSNETTSSEHCDSKIPDCYGSSKSDVLGTEANHVSKTISDLNEYQRLRRKPSEFDGDLTSRNSNSEIKKCDENYLDKNLRKKRHRSSLEKETDSSDKYQKSHRIHRDFRT